jgi:GH24 family phage-related lysozyme (muramidase)
MENNILKYQDYILQEHYNYIDSLMINESVGDNISAYLSKVFDRISKASKSHKKDILIYALTSLLLFNSSDKIGLAIKNNPIIYKEITNDPELKEVVKDKLENKKESKFKEVSTMNLSQNGLNHLKFEEGDPKKKGEPVLKAYKLGHKKNGKFISDGRITIGWGHAERINKSKFKEGQVISREKAIQLLNDDVKRAEDGIKRIFNEWQQEEGIERRITQDQFDALVSMAFNIGVTGLRKSQVIQEIKKGNFKNAGKLIKGQSLSKKFAGVEKRRDAESKLFMSYLDKDAVASL